MLPIAPLMIEHRLIEQMIVVIRKEIDRCESEGNINPEFIDAAVDFIRIYADKCHHGKEEDILFRDSNKKELPGEHPGRRFSMTLSTRNCLCQESLGNRR